MDGPGGSKTNIPAMILIGPFVWNKHCTSEKRGFLPSLTAKATDVNGISSPVDATAEAANRPKCVVLD
eukprot:3701128-Rhodomonas_salina.1